MRRILWILIVYLLLGISISGCENETTDTRQGCDGNGAAKTDQPPVPTEEIDTSADPLVAKGHYFRDAKGGVVFLRGVNVAGNSKLPPFAAVTSADDLQMLPSLGINTLRLLFTWEAFEPVEGEYDSDYLAYYQNVVSWAEQLGLYVIVDFHQDAYSRYLLNGCGEGFPQWAVTPEVELSTPDNGDSCSSWGVDMLFDLSLETAWTHFHSDKYGAKSAYLDMVETVVKEMAGYDNVIGYELINEPWGSDEELFTLFEQVGQRILNRDPSAVLFIPTHSLVTGAVREDTVEMPDFTNMAYSPHYYNGSVLLLKNWGGADPSRQLDKLFQKAERSNVPMLLSEFGAPAGTKNGLDYIKAHLNWLDKYWVSGTQWNYTPGWREDVKDGWNMEDLSIVDDNGELRDNFVARPYPQRIAGAPKSFALDDNGFSLTWNNRKDYGATIIFLPQGYAQEKELTLILPDGVSGSCDIEDHSVVCNVEGIGEAVLYFK
jgi:endoglycosylceramidase